MAQISVPGTATLLVDTQDPSSPCNYVLYNSGSVSVFLGSLFEGGVFAGASTVLSTSTGFALVAGQSIYGHLGAGDALYGITAGSTVTVHRLRTSS